MTAMPLSVFLFLHTQVVYMVLDPCRNQICLVGHHRVVRRLGSPGLQRIESVVAKCCPKEDVHRPFLFRFFRAKRRFFAISELSKLVSKWPVYQNRYSITQGAG